MATAEGDGKPGIRLVRAGWNAVTAAAGKLPGVGRKTSGPDETEKSEPPPEDVIVEHLPDALMERYFSVLVWLVHFDDGQIDERELCEIQVLMTQRRCNARVRQAVRSNLEHPHSLEPWPQIALMERVPSEMADRTLALKCSLIKDAIRVCRATSESPALEQPGIWQLAGMLELDEKKVEFIEDQCVQDEKILAGDVSDSHIKRAAKALAAKAGGSAFRSPPST